MERVQRIADELGISFGRATVYATRKKIISAKDAADINFGMLSTRQHEFKRSFFDCARYAPDPDLFLQQFMRRMQASSTADFSTAKKVGSV